MAPSTATWAPKHSHTRDEGCCSVGFIKSFFHIFNFIFLVSGGCVLGVGLWTIITKHQYVSLLTNLTYPLTAYVLVLAGGLSLAGALVGCCAVIRHNRCLLLMYTFLLLLIFLMEAMAGVLAYVYRGQVEKELEYNLNNTFTSNYGVYETQTNAIDLMQQEYKCCGASSYENWIDRKWLRGTNSSNFVPDSCCKTVSEGCGHSYNPSNIPYTGCVHEFTKQLQDQLVIICSGGLGFCAIQVFGMILACCLYIKLRNYSSYKGYIPGTTTVS